MLFRSFQDKYDYQTAKSFYKRISAIDIKNYAAAKGKILEMDKFIIETKKCAKALFAVTESCTFFDENNIVAIYTPKKGDAYELMYGNDVVTIVAKFMQTNCTYIICSTKRNDLILYPNYYNSTFGLYIHAIGVENFSKGWLRSGYDVVTSTYETMAKNNCNQIYIASVKKIVNQYYEKKDKKVFE